MNNHKSQDLKLQLFVRFESQRISKADFQIYKLIKIDLKMIITFFVINYDAENESLLFMKEC